MGVRGLQTFMEKYCPTACYPVYLSDLAEKYKIETGNDAVIVVDTQSCYFTWSKGLDSIVGLDVQELFHRIRKFVTSFEEIGVKLVFFIGGLNVEKKRKEWLRRQRNNLRKVYAGFDFLEEGTVTKNVPEEHNRLPPAVGVFVSLFLKHILNCEVYCTIKECDEEIVEYVHKHECIGIFAQDSDFIVSDIRQSIVLASQRFDQGRMATMMYDREELADILRIRTEQLALFGILLGTYTNTIEQENLTNFHRSICPVYFSTWRNIPYNILMPAVAKYIRELPDKPIDEILKLICVEIFGDESSLNSIERSYYSYVFQETSATANPTTKWSQILLEAEYRHRNFIVPSFIWGVVNDQVFELSATFEDLRRASGDNGPNNQDVIIPSSTVTRLLRRRIYGILLLEYKHLDDVEVTEWCGENIDSYNEPVLVKPVAPIVPHPGLLQLWSSNDDGRLNEMKWKLFLSCISPNITTTGVEKWRTLPDDLVPISATLFYLLEEKFMNEDEINAVIATVATHSLYDRKELNNIIGRYHPRRTHMSVVITRTYSMVISLMGACGYPVPISDKLICMKFEAKLFQIKYKEMKRNKSIEELCDNNDMCMNIFNQMKGVLRRAIGDDFERQRTSRRGVRSEWSNLEGKFVRMRAS
ncbi:constitutive coactivator of peroxisome proliferator-activated receptor gamma-like [Planococcus citri]|uniref:constitutive coactivator of peroxisome proliferator-activated receptor gamma-like n=1 Tax=Planococcus citri TaxID=170843 RepID=UPI0031F9D61B